MSNDLISRQAAIKALTQLRLKTMEKHEDVQKIWECEDAIVQCPSAQPEKKTGRWIISTDDYYPYCSICKNEPQGRIMTDYCPNCGAKMKK